VFTHSSSRHFAGVFGPLGRSRGPVPPAVVLVVLVVVSAVSVAVAAAAAVAVHRDHGDHEHDPQPVGNEELDHGDSF
jgi:hypothetical protein